MGERTDKITGRAKEAAGAVTNDDDLRAEGRADQTSGEVKGKAKDAADAVGDTLRDAADSVERKTREHT